jgi:hypothetical protein
MIELDSVIYGDIYLVVELAVVSNSVFVDQLESVAAVAVHVAVTVGGASVGEEERHLVARLGTQRQEIPEHIRILFRKSCQLWSYGNANVTLRLVLGFLFWVWMKLGNCCKAHRSLQRVFELDETHQHRIPDEEDGRVVANQIPVALISVKLHSETSWVTGSVSGSLFTTWITAYEQNPYQTPVLNIPTVENRTTRGAFLPMCSKIFALLYLVMS